MKIATLGENMFLQRENGSVVFDSVSVEASGATLLFKGKPMCIIKNEDVTEFLSAYESTLT